MHKLNKEKKMSKKLFAVFAILLTLSMILSACSSATPVATQESTTKADDSLTVVIIPKLVHEFYNMVYDGANTAVKELAAQGKQVNIIWSAPTTADSAEQVNKLEAAIALKPDVIAISVIDGELVKPLMEQAKAQGI